MHKNKLFFFSFSFHLKNVFISFHLKREAAIKWKFQFPLLIGSTVLIFLFWNLPISSKIVGNCRQLPLCLLPRHLSPSCGCFSQGKGKISVSSQALIITTQYLFPLREVHFLNCSLNCKWIYGYSREY